MAEFERVVKAISELGGLSEDEARGRIEEKVKRFGELEDPEVEYVKSLGRLLPLGRFPGFRKRVTRTACTRIVARELGILEKLSRGALRLVRGRIDLLNRAARRVIPTPVRSRRSVGLPHPTQSPRVTDAGHRTNVEDKDERD